MKLTVKGGDELKRALEREDKIFLQQVSKAIMDSAYFLESEIAEAIDGRRSPLPRRHDTGRYAGSVRAKQKGPLQANVESNVEYAMYVEKGTHNKNGTWKMRPGKHFEVTLDRNRQRITDSIQKAIKK